MAAPSIRHMNITMVFNEQIADAYHKTLKPAKEPTHYWHVERKAKRGNKWLFVSRFYCTKPDMAEIFCKFYRNDQRSYRLVHMLKY